MQLKFTRINVNQAAINILKGTPYKNSLAPDGPFCRKSNLIDTNHQSKSKRSARLFGSVAWPSDFDLKTRQGTFFPSSYLRPISVLYINNNLIYRMIHKNVFLETPIQFNCILNHLFSIVWVHTKYRVI